MQNSGIGFGNMKIMTIQYQQHHVLLNVNIQGENFTLRTLIDFGADINVLNKKVIPAKYWTPACRQVTGVGIQDFQYEVSSAAHLFTSSYTIHFFILL